MQRFVCIHGHFYQPPRENPRTGQLEEDPSARPFHDWNERITTECYYPNASTPQLDNGRITKFVNNYSSMSFDFGPTLLRWLERNSPETYDSILEADRESSRRFEGHGGGVAQVYNHMIMPLARPDEKWTQTLWGVEDFVRRFSRPPDGMWLPETAVDTASLECLAKAGIGFTILSPLQAHSVRRMGDVKWTDVSGGGIDTRRAYSCQLPSGRSISLFFYDRGISVDLAFGKLLEDGERFARRMMAAFGEDEEPQIVSVASDGETYGHHHRSGHISLARCLQKVEEGGKAVVSNYGHFLSIAPPKVEVRIIQPTSWSCPHGVERWRANCGCGAEIKPGYNQKWRTPLRESLDWLQAKLDELFATEGSRVFVDAREAKDHLGSVSMERSEERRRYLRAHLKTGSTDAQKEGAVDLAEMVVCSSLMLASCAWFWEDISRPEPVQALKLAARAISIAQRFRDGDLERDFESQLASAIPNDRRFRNASELYERFAKESR